MRTATLRVVAVILLATSIIGTDATAAIAAPAITGRVTFESFGVEGATIEVVAGGVAVRSATTTSTGDYEVAAPAPGTFDVRVTPPPALGVMTQTIRGVVVPASPASATLDVALRRPLGTVRTRAIDGNGTALAGLRVRLVTTTTGASVVDLAVTDATGVVELRAPVGVTYQLRIDAIAGSTAAVPADFALRIDQPVQATNAGTEVILSIPTATLDVTTNRSGSVAVGNVVVAATGSVTGLDLGGTLTATGSFRAVGTTGPAGTVSLPTLEGGVDVQAFPRDRLLLATSTSTTVAVSPTAVSLVLADAPTTSLSVTLLDGVGNPVPGATLTGATTASTDAVGTATVDVRSDVLSGVGLRASGDGVLDLPDQLLFTRVVPPAPSVTLQPTLADLVVEVVDDVTGTPIVGAVVSVSSPSIPAGDWNVRSTENARSSGGGGLASFRLVPGAGYGVTVTVGSTRIGSDSVTLAPGGTTATVRLPPAPTATSGFFPASISGRIVTPAGDGIAGLSVRSAVGGTVDTTDTDGAFSVGVAASGPHGLRISGSQLLRANGVDAEVPDRLDVWTAAVATVPATPGSVDAGTIELPIDRLDVRVTDETGGGLFDLVARTPLVGTRTSAVVGAASVSMSGSSGYVDDGVRLDEYGEGTMFLFSGTHRITVDEESLVNFSDVDLPVTEPTTLTAGNDTLLFVLTRRYGSPVTSLSGSPLVAPSPLTLELPDAVLTPIVELPEALLGGTTSTQIVLTDRFWCGESPRVIVTDPTTCPDATAIDISESGIPPELGPGTYPIAARSSVFASLPGGGTAFVQEGFRRSTLVLLAPVDEPPVLTDLIATSPAPEGSLTLLSAGASDAEGPVIVAWDLDGDGVGDAEGESVWVEAPDGPSLTSIGAIVTDSAGRSVRGSVELESRNVAPTATLRVNGPGTDGTVAVDVTDVDDPSSDDRATLVVELDLDGNGSYETVASTATIDARSLAADNYPVGARVTDDDGGVVLLSGSFVVEPPPSTDSSTTVVPTTATPTSAAPTTAAPTSAVTTPAAAVPTPPTSIDPMNSRLPETGTDLLGLLAAAFAAMAVGIVVIVATRRPRRRRAATDLSG